MCSYCASPLGLGADTPSEPTKTMQRLARMADHKDYAAAMAWDPPSELEHPRIRPLASRASVHFLVGSIIGFAALVRWVLPGGPDSVLAPALAVLAVIFFVLSFAGRWQAHRLLKTARQAPLLKRACLVRDRGSVMGEHGDETTTYMFDLEFGDGTQGDFAYPGRGASHDPMTRGATGVAYTRRNHLLAFKQIRV